MVSILCATFELKCNESLLIFCSRIQVKDRDNDESFKTFVTLIEKQSTSNSALKAEPLEDAIKQLVEKTVKEHESTEIQEQRKV